MDVGTFVSKWAVSRGSERATAQEHFIDLCRLLGERTPNEADPSGDIYAFEKGAKTPDGDGFADVWLKDHFAWEYKGKRKDLVAAYKQVSDYREALGNPPLLVVCDIDRYEVHTNWTNTEKWIYRFSNQELARGEPVQVSTMAGPARESPSLSALQVLKALFENPEELKPYKTTEQITQDAAKLFGKIADELRKWKVEDMRIARFITRALFCMFATDVGLLPKQTFSEIIAVYKPGGDARLGGDAKGFREKLSQLFAVMNTGGEFQMRQVPHFNGRLFEDDDVPEYVTAQEILILGELDDLNWAEVEPSIFGTLFERILDPAQKRMLGAHYTSRADIELIVEPVLMAPLRRRWEEMKAAAEEYEYRADVRGTKDEAKRERLSALLGGFIDRLSAIRVLDPACGSGNFLYVSLALLKALEKEVLAFASVHGVTNLRPRVHPRQLYGLEISPYAVELASVVIWIGYIQWKHRNVMRLEDEEPILEPLDQIQLKDAIVRSNGTPTVPEWQEADVIVGNPPFLGGKLLRRHLGDDYVDAIFEAWDGRVARESDLCCYWFEQARAQIEAGRGRRAGLLATQAIRGGANRKVLQRIKETGDIFYAQADRKWIQDGVAVRVSMIGFDDGTETRRLLNENKDDSPEHALERARPVEGINPNLTSLVDVTEAKRLKENVGMSFMGDTKVGPFDISEGVARWLLSLPNPDGRSNSDVVRPWVNGLDITRRPRRMWIIDFPRGMTESEAALYEAPFEYIKKRVKPTREKNARKVYAERWWIHGESRPEMRRALARLERYIVTPCISKHRLFTWIRGEVIPDHQLIVFAREDDYFFGILHSRLHEVWSLKLGTQLESRPHYTPTTSFETFPLPQPTDQQREAIAAAGAELNRLREGWLNPEVGGIGMAPKDLKKRTLTNLYNERPTWLVNAHQALDEAVFAAYGWEPGIGDGEILAGLLELNWERGESQ